MQVGSISIGLGNYGSDIGESPLEFAAEAAERFRSKIASLYRRPSPIAPDDHRLLTDDAATMAAVEEAFARSAAKSWDVFIVYMSGHGVPAGNGAQSAFLVSDDQIDAVRLSRLLEQVKAETLLLILDCCYAGGILSGCRFFTELEQRNRGRIWLASCSKDEASWEEARFQLPIFTHHLLLAFDHGYGATERPNQIDVEIELFHRIRDRVSADSHHYKKSEQTPIKGGTSVAHTYLPLAKQGFVRDLLFSQVRRRILWRLARIFLALSVLTLLLIQLLFYHITSTPDGRLEISRGLKETDFLFPRAWSTRVDLPVAWYDLVGGANESTKDHLLEGRHFGLWFQNDEMGRRRWASSLLEQLGSGPKAVQIKVRLGGAVDEHLFEDTWSRGKQWVLESAAEEALLNGDKQNSLLDDVFLLEGIPCGGTFDEFSSTEVLQPSTDEVRQRLTALHAILLTRTDSPVEALVAVQRIIAFRASSERFHINVWREVGEYVRTVEAFKRSLKLRSRHLVDGELEPLLDESGNCKEWNDLTLAILGLPTQLAEDYYIGKLRTSEELGADAFLHLQILASLCRAGKLSAKGFDAVYGLLPEEPEREGVDRFSWLLLTEGKVPTDSDFVGNYTNGNSAQWAGSSDKVTPRFVFTSLKRQDLSSDQVDSLRAYVASIWPDSVHDDFGLQLASEAVRLGLREADSLDEFWPDSADTDFEMLLDRDQNAGGYEIHEELFRWEWFVTLVDAVKGGQLKEDRVEFLAAIADRFAFRQPFRLDSVYQALGAHYFGTADDTLASEIKKRLTKCKSDGRRLVTEQGIAAVFVAGLPAERRYSTLNALMEIWDQEREPQLRLAFAVVVLCGYEGDDGDPDNSRFADLADLGQRSVPLFFR